MWFVEHERLVFEDSMAGLLLFLLLAVSVVSADEGELAPFINVSHNVCFLFLFLASGYLISHLKT